MKKQLLIFMVFLCVMGTKPCLSFGETRIRITKISFAGNKIFTSKQLLKVMVCRPSGLLRHSYYNENVLTDDIHQIVLLYHHNGYLDAKISDYSVTMDERRSKATVVITIEEGELIRVEGVSVLGNSVFGDDELLKRIAIREGGAFRSKKIEDSVLMLITLYADNGYLDADVTYDTRINPENKRAIITFTIQENRRYTIDQIRLQGLEKTKPGIVRKELHFKTGEFVNYSKLLESQNRTYLTGLFQSVFIHPQPSDSGDSTKRDILIEVKEKKSGEFSISLGYGTLDQGRGKIEIFNNNLWGTARKIGFLGKLSFINRVAQTSVSAPRFLGTSWQTDATFLVHSMNEPGYDFNRIGFQTTFGREIGKRLNLKVAYRLEDGRLKNVKTSELPDDMKPNIRSMKCSLIRDTRNNLFNATQGSYYELSNEFFVNDLDTFIRSSVLFKYFRGFSGSTVLGTAFEAGWVDSPEGFAHIPLQERFYAGGPNSIRGFGYQKVGPLDNKRVPIGGRLKCVWNILEVRRGLYKKLSGAVFADAGNVWMNPHDFGLKDIRYSLGLGLRLTTPIGIGRLDYGFNVRPREGESKNQWYFSLGQAF